MLLRLTLEDDVSPDARVLTVGSQARVRASVATTTASDDEADPASRRHRRSSTSHGQKRRHEPTTPQTQRLLGKCVRKEVVGRDVRVTVAYTYMRERRKLCASVARRMSMREKSKREDAKCMVRKSFKSERDAGRGRVRAAAAGRTHRQRALNIRPRAAYLA